MLFSNYDIRKHYDPIFPAFLLKLDNGNLEIEIDYFKEAIKIPKHFYCNYDNFTTSIFSVTEINGLSKC